MNKRLFFCLSLLFLLTTYEFAVAIPTERPFIWATESDRGDILDKIKNYKWAKDLLESMKQRADKRCDEYNRDKDAYLKNFVLDWTAPRVGDNYPPFEYCYPNDPIFNVKCTFLMNNIQFMTDCSVLYYLTRDEKYAQVSLDVLYTITMALNQTERRRGIGGAWIFLSDLLRETRFVSAVPITYDFLSPFIKQGGKAYNMMTQDYQIPSDDAFQHVFLNYAQAVVENGHAGSNWSVLEGSTLLNCALALEDIELRNRYIDFYLNTSTDAQSSLDDIASRYTQLGDIWPETSQYSNDVAHLSSYLIYVLTKYDPDLEVAQKYRAIPWALPRWTELIYPNGDVVNFGDGLRYVGVQPDHYEPAYALSLLVGDDLLKDRIGTAMVGAIKDGYDRPRAGREYTAPQASYYLPTVLLWGVAEIEGRDETDVVLPRTDHLSHAGLFIQRNLSSTDRAKDGLMLTVAGASHVHSHAGGMNIELYGKGYVLGADNGRLNYQKDVHENYSRLYAAHNTVISNGKSSSTGGWVNLGTKTVQKVSMEPEPFCDAISENYSYTTTSFEDQDMGLENADHQRTLAIVRTSATTGYYVDVFRARSKQEGQFHDYIYHNVSDRLIFKGRELQFESTPDRYMECASKPWVQNREFRHPGWHFFENVETSQIFEEGVEGVFQADDLSDSRINMRFFITAEREREYTKVIAPPTFSMRNSYKERPTPTFVMRKQGDAWDQPFAVIYEPTEGKGNYDGDGSVRSVNRLESSEGLFKGFCVESKIGGRNIKQYIIVQDRDESFEIAELGIKHTGHIAIITFENGNLKEIYAGDTISVKCGDVVLSSKSGEGEDLYMNVK